MSGDEGLRMTFAVLFPDTLNSGRILDNPAYGPSPFSTL
jgi:hypothetical protein